MALEPMGVEALGWPVILGQAAPPSGEAWPWVAGLAVTAVGVLFWQLLSEIRRGRDAAEKRADAATAATTTTTEAVRTLTGAFVELKGTIHALADESRKQGERLEDVGRAVDQPPRPVARRQ